jgi:hypothetical protein
MRRRERAFALVLGTICSLSLLAGAWPLPIVAFVLLELSYTAVEHAADLRARRVSAARTAVRRYRQEAAGGILPGTP